MGILSGMLIAAGVAYFTKKKTNNKNNPNNASASHSHEQQENSPNIAHKDVSQANNQASNDHNHHNKSSIDKNLGDKQ